MLVGGYGLIENDGQEIALLAETLHTVVVGGHVGDGKGLQLQHEGGKTGCCVEVNKSLTLQRAIGKVEAPKVDFIVRNINVLANGLRLYTGKSQ